FHRIRPATPGGGNARVAPVRTVIVSAVYHLTNTRLAPNPKKAEKHTCTPPPVRKMLGMDQPGLELLVRVGLATLLGVAIGLERQWRSRMAGLQTMALVSMGSALFTIMGAYAFGGQGDRNRVAAQIVTGIGFLGAGVIIKSGMTVFGLNTAA